MSEGSDVPEAKTEAAETLRTVLDGWDYYEVVGATVTVDLEDGETIEFSLADERVGMGEPEDGEHPYPCFTKGRDKLYVGLLESDQYVAWLSAIAETTRDVIGAEVTTDV